MVAKVHRLHPDATFDKAHYSDIGFDLTCCGWEIKDGVYRLKLGVAVEPGRDYYFMLVPRSSFSKYGWTQANNVGIIDPDYRGEWMMNVALIYKGIGYYNAWEGVADLIGKKVAQAIPQYRIYGGVKFVEQLSSTERGEGGFGSTDQLTKYKPGDCLTYEQIKEERRNQGHPAGTYSDRKEMGSPGTY